MSTQVQQPTQPPLTLTDLRQRTVVSVEEAGRLLGVGRGGAYKAAGTGDIPTIRVGRRLVVPAAALLRMLAADDQPRQPVGI